MYPYYKDIRRRLGDPLWFDNRGVPRYDAFEPSLCGVYCSHIAYLEIACQRCKKKFFVSVERTSESKLKWSEGYRGRPFLPNEGGLGAFYYGDAPGHPSMDKEEEGNQCVGTTMTCEEIRVVEFWSKTAESKWEWVREPLREVKLDSIC